MIIGGLIALFSIFFGGPEVSLFVEDFDKQAKKHIEDKVRKDLVITQLKEYNTFVEAHKKRNKSFVKDLDAMIMDPLVTQKSFIIFFESVILAREELQAAYTRMRVNISK